MIYLFNKVLAIFLIVFLLPVFLIVAILIFLESSGPIFFFTHSIGKNGNIFKMPKFRTLKINSPIESTEKFHNIDNFKTPLGQFLRSFSLDELPQLFSVLKGDMGLVGPRPALCIQDDLIALRIQKGVDKLLPGITGWAQVNGRDNLSIPEKVAFEVEYMNQQSIWFDIKILCITLLKILRRDGVSH